MTVILPITLYGRKPYNLPTPNPILVGDMNYESAIDFIMNQELFALDIETTNLKPHSSSIITIQIGNEDIQYIFHMDLFSHKDKLANALSSTKALIIGHNLKFDITFLLNELGITLNKIWDTYCYEKLVTTKFQTSNLYNYALKDGVSYKYLNQRFSVAARSSFIGADISKKLTKDQIKYAAMDVILPLYIYYAQFYGVFQQRKGNRKKYCLGYLDIKKSIPGIAKTISLEMNFIPVLAQVEVNGFKLDRNIWIIESNKATIWAAKMETEILEELEKEGIITSSKKEQQLSLMGDDPNGIRHIILRKVGKRQAVPFKLSNSGHVTEVLNRLGFTVSASGDDVLRTIDHPLVDMIRSWRGYNKIVTSYGTKMLDYINKNTGRIHADFDPYYASGRITPSEPNLANIPKPREELDLRKAFICEKGNKLITIDMSSVEVRIIAELCEDTALIKSLNDGVDPHKFIASVVYNIDYNSVTPAQRVIAKRVLFGYAYGAGPATIARQADITFKSAMDFISKFDREFPTVQKYFRELHKEVINKGYVSTIGGRPRIFDIPVRQMHYEWSPLERRDFEEKLSGICRQAGNHPIQGTNADATKRAMIMIQRYIEDNNVNAMIVNVVHDELVIEILEQEAEWFSLEVSRLMEDALRVYVTKIPVSTSILIGDCWMKD